ncbi:MAG: hypothetical protein ABEL51_00985 [Salinibacter sp.]
MKRPLNHRSRLPLLAAGLTATLLLSGCGGNEYRPKVTEILHVEVDPSPVPAGDTAVFTCVIEDSLESGFRFEWNQFDPTYEFPLAVTDTNQYPWKAPSDSGMYAHQVIVKKPGAEAGPAGLEPKPVRTRFEVVVSQNPNRQSLADYPPQLDPADETVPQECSTSPSSECRTPQRLHASTHPSLSTRNSKISHEEVGRL